MWSLFRQKMFRPHREAATRDVGIEIIDKDLAEIEQVEDFIANKFPVKSGESLSETSRIQKSLFAPRKYPEIYRIAQTGGGL